MEIFAIFSLLFSIFVGGSMHLKDIEGKKELEKKIIQLKQQPKQVIRERLVFNQNIKVKNLGS